MSDLATVGAVATVTYTCSEDNTLQMSAPDRQGYSRAAGTPLSCITSCTPTEIIQNSRPTVVIIWLEAVRDRIRSSLLVYLDNDKSD